MFAPAGAAPVIVDGRLVDETGRIYVEPGQHEVTAVLPDGRKARSTVRVAAGKSQAVALSPEPASLHPVAPPPVVPAGAPAQPAAPPAPWLLYAGSAASGAFLVSGIVLHIVASLEDSALQAEMRKPRSAGNPKLLEGLHAIEPAASSFRSPRWPRCARVCS
ncbi:hypothetical protein ACMHYB_09455 [Sorangium sp. So ce1128]